MTGYKDVQYLITMGNFEDTIGQMKIRWLKNKKPTRCHLLFLFYFLETQHVLGINMPSSRICNYVVKLPHWLFCYAKMEKSPLIQSHQKLNSILKQYLKLDNYYPIVNSSTLAQDLTKLYISIQQRLITLDIKDLYVNIPIAETIVSARLQLLKRNGPEITAQICKLLESILQKELLHICRKNLSI